MLALLVAALLAAPPSVTLATKPPATAGEPWAATLVVRGVPAPTVLARGGGATVRAKARRVGVRFRVRLVFPREGTWTLTAHARGRTFRLGAIDVRPRPFVLGILSELAVEPDGSLLVVEGRPARLLRIDPVSGRVAIVARDLGGAFGLARFPDGSLAISAESIVLRLDPATGTRSELARIDGPAQIGPLAVDAAGRLFFGTNGSDLYRLDAGGRRLLASGLGVPHGIEVAPDGALLVSATENDQIVRVDPETGASTVVAAGVAGPLGIAVAADGTMFVSEFETHRVLRIAPDGARTVLWDGFAAPVGLALGVDGTLYVGDSQRGAIYRFGPNGRERLRLLAPR